MKNRMILLNSFKSRIQKYTVGFVLFFAAASLFALPTTEEMYTIISKTVDQNLKGDARLTLSVVDEKPGKPKGVAQYQCFVRPEEDRFCMVQLAPEAEKGHGYLQQGDNLWQYNPSSKSFTHSSLKRNIGDSNLKGEDIRKNKKFRDQWTITDISEGKLGKIDVYVVKIKLNKGFDRSYPINIFYIDKKSSLILKIGYYGASERLMRTSYYLKYTDLHGVVWPVQEIYVNELVKGEKSTTVYSDFSFDSIPDVVFTKAYLEKVN